MSSSRRRRNKWLRTISVGWIYHNPYLDAYVRCDKIIDNENFQGKLLLLGNTKVAASSLNVGADLQCCVATCTNRSISKSINYRYSWKGISKINKKQALYVNNRFDPPAVWYKMYEL